MRKKVITHISDSYITLLILFPYILFYLNGFFSKITSNKFVPIVLVLVYLPTIVWSLVIRKNDNNAKYHIGAVKLLFSLNALPLVTLIFINFVEANYVNTINLYIVLMTALFFNLDGQSDLHDAFKYTIYFQNLKYRKLAYDIFSRLLRRFVFFFGIGLLSVVLYLLFMANHYHQLPEYPFYISSIFYSATSMVGIFFLGWTFLAINAQKKLRYLLEERVSLNEQHNDSISSLVNLLYLPFHIKFLIKWGPILLFVLQQVIRKLWFNNFISYKYIVLNSVTGIIVYLIVFLVQVVLLKKNKYF